MNVTRAIAHRASVILCSYSSNRYPLLVAAVESVLGQTRPAAEIIVVIDHNRELFERVSRRFPTLIVIENEGLKGLSGARNTGTWHALGDIVVYLDDDAHADPVWLEMLIRHYDRPEVLGVDGYAEPDWETSRPRWWPDEFDWVIGCSYRGLPSSVAPVRNLMGCAMSMRREIVDAAGGFDPSLGRTATGAAGCEETELCLRATERFPQGVFLHEPAARVRHHVPSSRGRLKYFRQRCFAEGVSKRLVTRRAGADAGLASEFTYVRRTLPCGVVRNAVSALRGDAGGALRAVAIGVGATTTMLGFLSIRTGRPAAGAVDLPPVDPVLPLVIEVSDGPQSLGAAVDDYRRASCLILVNGEPVGTRAIELDGTETSSADLLDRLGVRAGVDGQITIARELGRVRNDTTVAIATRGRPGLLAECLDSIAAGTLLPGRIIVVDNARPDDRTEQLIARYRSGGCAVEYVREDRPGLAHAHNTALRHVHTDLVAYTDDDVWVHERWLENITRAFDADPGTVCVTGMIAPRELDTLEQQWVEAQGVYSKGYDSRVFDAAQNRTDDPMFPYTAGSFGSGANMAFRTGYLLDTGGFDVALGTGTVAMGGDDLAAFYDVIRRGHRLTYEPSAIVLHPHHRDYAALRRQAYGYGAGLGAHLTRCILAEPRAAVTIARHHRAAAARLDAILHPRIPGLPEYPRDLSRAQRSGLASGPARYLLSCYRSRNVTRTQALGGETT